MRAVERRQLSAPTLTELETLAAEVSGAPNPKIKPWLCGSANQRLRSRRFGPS